MKIFIDSADLNEIKKYLEWGLCQGVTTNPTICLKCGVTGGMDGIKKRTIEIAELIKPYPVSVEVTSDKLEDILSQARDYAQLAESVVIKITVTDRSGNSLLPAVYQLTKEGISINVTAMTTFNQAILAARALRSGYEKAIKKPKFSFISIFGGRISEEQGVEQAFKVIKDVREWLDFHKFDNVEIIVGSVRSPENVELWSRTGAHILTIPPEVIAKSLLSARTKETVSQFIDDAQKSMGELNNK
ncbi:MAG TPA: transaldolase family protein [Candidatus Paceibacterota bacterium]|nr:transaldolase family protein [Candidatus Paceibacterota bacterium]